MHLFISAGEPSGDQHAAQLMQELRKRSPDMRVSGFGGPEAAKAGQEQLFRLTDLAVMGFLEVLPMVRKFWNLYKQAAAYLERERPDAVLLVDFPGFNWWIAKAAKRAGIPVYFYCPPQLWAWAGWRIRKVRKFVDCVLAVLPFEAKFYRDRGVDVEYVGHPFFDEVASHALDENVMETLQTRGEKRLAVLPGSRKQEVNRNFPIMLNIISKLHARHPEVRFPVACYKQWHHDRCRELLAEHKEELPLDFYVGKTSEVIQAADCCLIVSGSVSLELLARGKPAVVVYYAASLIINTVFKILRTRFITLPNLIADRELMPETACSVRSGPHIDRLYETLDHWLSDSQALTAAQQDVAQLAESVVQAGGLKKCAEVLLRKIDTSNFTSESNAASRAA